MMFEIGKKVWILDRKIIPGRMLPEYGTLKGVQTNLLSPPVDLTKPDPEAEARVEFHNPTRRESWEESLPFRILFPLP